MRRIHAISSYGPSAGSTRIRLINWFNHLEVAPTYHHFAGLPNSKPRTILRALPGVAQAHRSARRLDLKGESLVLSREASPFSSGQLEVEYLTRAAWSVYDIDDALFHDASLLRQALNRRSKYHKLAAAADTVIAGNSYLANWAQHHNNDVRIIPSCIDPASYVKKSDWNVTSPHPVLVWLGSPSTEHYLARISSELLEVHRTTGARLIIISGPHDTKQLAQLAGMSTRIPWGLNTFAEILSTADVALGPLDDSPFSRGKCAFKLLQYAATGIPMIGSPVGANRLALQRFGGLSAQTSDEWVSGVLELISMPCDSRAAIGRHSQGAVEEHYSFSAWETEWRDAVNLPDPHPASHRDIAEVGSMAAVVQEEANDE